MRKRLSSLRLLIAVGACQPFAATFRSHAGIVFVIVNLRKPASPGFSLRGIRCARETLGQTGGSPSAGEKGVGGDPKAEGIGSTGSTHNPTGSAPNTTGMENRTGTEVGTDTSTHNPTGKKD